MILTVYECSRSTGFVYIQFRQFLAAEDSMTYGTDSTAIKTCRRSRCSILGHGYVTIVCTSFYNTSILCCYCSENSGAGRRNLCIRIVHTVGYRSPVDLGYDGIACRTCIGEARELSCHVQIPDSAIGTYFSEKRPLVGIGGHGLPVPFESPLENAVSIFEIFRNRQISHQIDGLALESIASGHCLGERCPVLHAEYVVLGGLAVRLESKFHIVNAALCRSERIGRGLDLIVTVHIH